MPPAGTVIQSGPANSQGVILPAGTTQPSQTLYLVCPSNVDFLTIVVNTTVSTASNTVLVTVNGITQSGYTWLLLANSAIASVTTHYLAIGPGLPVTASAPIFSANNMVPNVVQIATTIVGVPTYGIDYVSG
jgi:hypothetical protein